VVDVLALGTLLANSNIGVNFAAGDLGEFSYNVECEGAEVADVHGLSLAKIVVKVGDKGFPYDKHLISEG
jgi:hypothetical protein